VCTLQQVRPHSLQRHTLHTYAIRQEIDGHERNARYESISTLHSKHKPDPPFAADRFSSVVHKAVVTVHMMKMKIMPVFDIKNNGLLPTLSTSSAAATRSIVKGVLVGKRPNHSLTAMIRHQIWIPPLINALVDASSTPTFWSTGSNYPHHKHISKTISKRGKTPPPT